MIILFDLYRGRYEETKLVTAMLPRNLSVQLSSFQNDDTQTPQVLRAALSLRYEVSQPFCRQPLPKSIETSGGVSPLDIHVTRPGLDGPQILRGVCPSQGENILVCWGQKTPRACASREKAAT